MTVDTYSVDVSESHTSWKAIALLIGITVHYDTESDCRVLMLCCVYTCRYLKRCTTVVCVGDREP